MKVNEGQENEEEKQWGRRKRTNKEDVVKLKKNKGAKIGGNGSANKQTNRNGRQRGPQGLGRSSNGE